MTSSSMTRVWWALGAGVVLLVLVAAFRFMSFPAAILQPSQSRIEQPPAVRRWEDVDRDIAARFAPTFYQGVIGSERFDYITNFDFDGDWRGDNNWEHAADRQYPMKAFVYYAVSETPTHYFVHYAAFHPRDWKGGERTGRFLSGAVREGTTVGGVIKPHGVMDELVLSHENDLEGCLVVVEKHGAELGAARVVLVETMAHNQYLRFALEPESAAIKPLRLDEQHPLLYVEAQGHGIEAFHDQPVSTAEPVDARPVLSDTDAGTDSEAPAQDEHDAPKKGRLEPMKRITKVKGLVTNRFRVEGQPTRLVTYKYSGAADNPETITAGPVGYDLQPLYSTFWTAAARGENDTFGESTDYGTRTILVLGPGAGNMPTIAPRQITIGRIGSALRGVAGAPNKARAPWGWFDRSERSRPPGEWFFDPAATTGRHLGGAAAGWASAYLHQPFLGVIRSAAMTAGPIDPASTLVPAVRR